MPPPEARFARHADDSGGYSLWYDSNPAVTAFNDFNA